MTIGYITCYGLFLDSTQGKRLENQTILIAGATGTLGGRVARELRLRDASVRAIVRPGTDAQRLNTLRQQGAEVIEAGLDEKAKMTKACEGVACVVSTLLGLAPVMIDAQGALLDAAVEAGVPRFIPSDFAMDFTKIEPGLNRNFDLHRQFRVRLKAAPIRSTAVLNGAFMNLLTGEAPLVLFKIKRVLYWGDNPEQKLDFTTMDDTAAYTAEVALDPDAPEILRIAGEQISAAGLARVASELSGERFRLLRGGGLGRLQRIIGVAKALTPKSDAPFPIWQGMQYLYCMYEGSGMLTPLDNERYPNLAMDGRTHVAHAGFVSKKSKGEIYADCIDCGWPFRIRSGHDDVILRRVVRMSER